MTKGFSPVHIDKQRLPEEWLAHSEHLHGALEAVANAHADTAHAEKDFDRVKADLYLRMEAEPSRYGLKEKPTVNGLTASVERHPSYLAAYDELIRTRRVFEIMRGRAEAIREKGKALSDLVKYDLAGYFSQRGISDVTADTEVSQECERIMDGATGDADSEGGEP